MKKKWAVLAAAGWLVTANAADPDTQVEASALCEQGLAEYEIGHYVQAVAYFRSAAELGDARAIEVLALMYRLGERLYGGQVRVDKFEAARWAAVAAVRRQAAVTKVVSAND